MAMLSAIRVDAGKLRTALTVKVCMTGMRPTKIRLWFMILVIRFARFVGGCKFELETSFDDGKISDALTFR
jgi:hypothetical protein